VITLLVRAQLKVVSLLDYWCGFGWTSAVGTH
jgi:hypothetical protein